jgi:hypothetical protein
VIQRPPHAIQSWAYGAEAVQPPHTMIAEAPWNIEDFGKRIQAMREQKLSRYGRAAGYMADPRNAVDKQIVLEVYVIQSRECRAEFRRRHPKRIYVVTRRGWTSFVQRLCKVRRSKIELAATGCRASSLA